MTSLHRIPCSQVLLLRCLLFLLLFPAVGVTIWELVPDLLTSGPLLKALCRIFPPLVMLVLGDSLSASLYYIYIIIYNYNYNNKYSTDFY